MGLLVSSEQMVRDEAHRRSQAVIAQFRNAIRPIYRYDGKPLPVHVGTCTLFEVGETKLVATAAHIIDQHEKSELGIGGTKALIPLTGMLRGTAAPNNDRSLDKYDFSASIVTADLADELGSVSYIAPEFTSKGRRQDRTRDLYTCVGYPRLYVISFHAVRSRLGYCMWRERKR
jgi:hypothetical protein